MVLGSLGKAISQLLTRLRSCPQTHEVRNEAEIQESLNHDATVAHLQTSRVSRSRPSPQFSMLLAITKSNRGEDEFDCMDCSANTTASNPAMTKEEKKKKIKQRSADITTSRLASLSTYLSSSTADTAREPPPEP
jgi:hypothetical protein